MVLLDPQFHAVQRPAIQPFWGISHLETEYETYATASLGIVCQCTSMPQRRNGVQQRNDGKTSGEAEIRKSENVTIQLQDWHPATGGYMNGANDYDLARVDAISTYAPLWIRTPGIWLASPDKRIHGSPYVVRKPKQADRIALTRFVANLNLALKLDVTRPDDAYVCC